MKHLFYWFAVITGVPVFWPVFRTKVYYEDRSVQGRFIPRRTIVVSNHLQLFDYIVFLLATVPRFSHSIVAEVMYQQNFLVTFFLKALGCIRVDRESHSTKVTEECVRQLNKGRVIYTSIRRVVFPRRMRRDLCRSTRALSTWPLRAGPR